MQGETYGRAGLLTGVGGRAICVTGQTFVVNGGPMIQETKGS